MTAELGVHGMHSGMGVILAKGIGGVGSAFSLFTAAGILGWQILGWLSGDWVPLSVNATLTRLGLSVGGTTIDGIDFAWALDASAVLAALMAAVLLAALGLRAAAVERQRNAAWLFRSYMDEARGSVLDRRESGR